MRDEHPDPAEQSEEIHPRVRAIARSTLALGLVAAVAVAFLWFNRSDDDLAVEQPEEAPTTERAADVETTPPLGNSAVPYEGEPLWTVTPQGTIEAVAAVGAGFLMRSADEVYFEADGEAVWSQAINEPSSSGAKGVVHLSGDVVLVESSVTESVGFERVLTARDAATGETLWQTEDLLEVAVFEEVVLLVVDDQDDPFDEFPTAVVARDVNDGSVLWQTDTDYSLGGITAVTDDSDPVGFAGGGPLPEHFVVALSMSERNHNTFSVFDTATGELVADPSDSNWRNPMNARVNEDLIILQWDKRENPTSGCTAHIAAYRLGEVRPASFSPVWEQWVDAPQEGEVCLPLPPLDASEGLLPVSISGRPVLLDVATGEKAWSDDDVSAHAIAASGNVLLALDWDSTESRTAVWNLETGAMRWEGYRLGTDTWLAGDRIWASFGGVIGYDTATAEAISLPGQFAHTLPGVIVTRVGNEWHAWPDDI
ncbi:PQQ-binding-like beta-propeller repeat protein [Glycomyces sp. NPDC046736]|uniref:outer membrane protein assembly factor BamB family protein n=1 Tax=Glycomyces sp. NPDC046736 TaxID=3155615 RepID=UPI0033C0E2DB